VGNLAPRSPLLHLYPDIKNPYCGKEVISMKKHRTLALLCAAVLGLSGCGGQSSAESQAESSAAGQTTASAAASTAETTAAAPSGKAAAI
jgi:hypothetical protein